MLKELFTKIASGEEIKTSLAEFKQELGKTEDISRIPSSVTEGYTVFCRLLQDDDPKVRKNAALILGMLHCQNALDDLYQGYISDETLYNKAAYLKAIGSINFDRYKDELLKKRDELISISPSAETKKHLMEELHELNMLLMPCFEKHNFVGNELVNECVLLTNRNFKQVTMKELGKIPHKEFTAGVMVKTKQIDYVLHNVRTYSELLFVPETIKTVSAEASIAAQELTDSDIISYISCRLSNPDSPIRFRIEDRGKDSKLSAIYARTLGSELELLSHGRFINSTDNYEIELRFIDNSDGRKVVLIQFCMLKDTRFSYRKHSLAVSLRPYLAALFIQLSSGYLKDNAAVLDPFCGCGTMLTEREKFSPARLYYGIDLFGDAVTAARDNIKAAGFASKCELIKRDFFDFKHEYKFDEIITDMPFSTNAKTPADIENIYKRFFKAVDGFCEKDAHLFIYSRNRDYLRKYSLANGFKILEEFEISKIEKAYFFILAKN